MPARRVKPLGGQVGGEAGLGNQDNHTPLLQGAIFPFLNLTLSILLIPSVLIVLPTKTILSLFREIAKSSCQLSITNCTTRETYCLCTNTVPEEASYAVRGIYRQVRGRLRSHQVRWTAKSPTTSDSGRLQWETGPRCRDSSQELDLYLLWYSMSPVFLKGVILTTCYSRVR